MQPPPTQSHWRPTKLFVLFVVFLSTSLSADAQKFDYKKLRRQMVEREIISAGVKDRRVIESMLQTDRHEFVLPNYRKMAYFDMSLPIGGEQTISSPFIVAYMTESIDPQLTDKVLEIGTGSGFQAAVLSPLVDEVYTIEIVEPLGRKAARLLKKLKYDNVHVKVGDGFKGWPEHAPFDKIVVTCSPEDVPKPLVEQLREGGRMVIPTGERYQQTLYLFTKKDGKLIKEALRPTLFVPMTGAAEKGRDVKPDPTRPVVINGDFEEKFDKETIVPGWYYGRQVKLTKSSFTNATEDRREGSSSGQFVEFSNSDDGRGSHVLQGLAIDGRAVPRINFTATVKLESVRASRDGTLPTAMITFYDQHRQEVGKNWLGPWRGTSDWKKFDKILRVPQNAREAIVRVGLFGATGKMACDNVKLGSP